MNNCLSRLEDSLDYIGIVFRATEAFAWYRRTNDLETLTEKAETLEIASNSKKIKVEKCQAKIKDKYAKLGERVLEQSWE